MNCAATCSSIRQPARRMPLKMSRCSRRACRRRSSPSGLNYRSHLGGRPAPSSPEIFYKPVSCLQDPGVSHRDSTRCDQRAFGRRTGGGDRQDARKTHRPRKPATAIFGVTCGNDVSERDWQHGPHKDLQWWRAKGADTFGPLGPCIVTGIDESSLLLANPHQRRNRAEAIDLGPDVRLPGDRQLHQPMGDARAGRPDLHRHARRDQENESRRYRGSGDRRDRRVKESGGMRTALFIALGIFTVDVLRGLVERDPSRTRPPHAAPDLARRSDRIHHQFFRHPGHRLIRAHHFIFQAVETGCPTSRFPAQ